MTLTWHGGEKTSAESQCPSVNRWIDTFRGKPVTLCKGLSWEATGEATGQVTKKSKNRDPLGPLALRIC